METYRADGESSAEVALKDNSIRNDVESSGMQEEVDDMDISINEERSKLKKEVEELKKQVGSLKEQQCGTERKMVALTRERDFLRKTHNSRSADAQLVKEKNKQIAAIMEEGEKLSIKISEREEREKELRAIVREQREELKDIKSLLSSSDAKAEGLSSRVKELEASLQSTSEAKDAVERRMQEIGSETRSLASSSAALEAARAQLDSLRKSQTSSLEQQATRLKAEFQAAEEAREDRHHKIVKAHERTIEGLRSRLSQTEETTHWKEEEARTLAENLRKQCEALESRNESLAAALPNATKPLMRQISALQSAAKEQEKAVAASKASLLSRVKSADQAAAAASEQVKHFTDKSMVLSSEVTSLMEQARASRMDANNLSKELRTKQALLEDAEARNGKLLEQHIVEKKRLNEEKREAVEALAQERANHEEACNKLKVRIEDLKVELLSQKKLKRLEAAPAGMNASTLSETVSATPAKSTVEGKTRASKNELDITPTSLTESYSAPDGMYVTERLSSALRLKKGEVENLQAIIKAKESASSALADEVVTLTARCEELSRSVEDGPGLREELKELRQRHNTLLELFGEREERVGELEADLLDIKKINKEQITELLLKIEHLEAQR